MRHYAESDKDALPADQSTQNDPGGIVRVPTVTVLFTCARFLGTFEINRRSSTAFLIKTLGSHYSFTIMKIMISLHVTRTLLMGHPSMERAIWCIDL
jgi:hypothetical protein